MLWHRVEMDTLAQVWAGQHLDSWPPPSVWCLGGHSACQPPIIPALFLNGQHHVSQP